MIKGQSSFKLIRQRQIQIAKDLHYPGEVIRQLLAAEDESELIRIMITQRRKEKSK